MQSSWGPHLPRREREGGRPSQAGQGQISGEAQQKQAALQRAQNGAGWKGAGVCPESFVHLPVVARSTGPAISPVDGKAETSKGVWRKLGEGGKLTPAPRSTPPQMQHLIEKGVPPSHPCCSRPPEATLSAGLCCCCSGAADPFVGISFPLSTRYLCPPRSLSYFLRRPQICQR